MLKTLGFFQSQLNSSVMTIDAHPKKIFRQKRKRWKRRTYDKNIVSFLEEHSLCVVLSWFFLTFLLSLLAAKLPRAAGGNKSYLNLPIGGLKWESFRYGDCVVEFSSNLSAVEPSAIDHVDYDRRIGGIVNRARIGRIYRNLLGGRPDRTEKVAVVPGWKSGAILPQLPLRKKTLCEDTLKREGRLRLDLSAHNLSLVVPPPLPCVSRHRVAVIIPYRDREEHLLTLLNTLHPLLQRQQIHYRVYVVEQFGNDTFNKGVLMNAGARESLRDQDFGCFVFHDVDLIPEDDRNMYSCPPYPRHMSVAVDKFNYTLPYSLLVGGVFSIRLEHFLAVNGYSNLYWGWGGEDDDMAYRIKYRKLEIIRPPETIARYSMIKHEHRPESPNAIRTALLRMAKKRSSRDGLNTVKYRVVWRHDTPSHTHLMIDIGRNHRWHFMDSQQRLIINF